MTQRNTITTNEFNLITTSIQGLLKTTGHSKTAVERRAIFACFGAAVMKSKLNIPCRPVAGAWQIHHPNGQLVLGIGQEVGRRVYSNERGFHMWVQTETHIIDFMSPLYPELFPEAHSIAPIPRAMLQVSREEDAKNMRQFLDGHPLLTLPNPVLTEFAVDQVLKRPSSRELMSALLQWWIDLETAPYSGLDLLTSTGRYLKIFPSGCSAEGVWKGPSVIAHGA